jgi:hypothetical protein
MGNVVRMSRGLLQQRKYVLFAGHHYNDPWPRDASVNASSGTGLILPAVTRNSLPAVLKKSDRGPYSPIPPEISPPETPQSTMGAVSRTSISDGFPVP